MLRYKTETRPGLVTLYDIRPGNGAGQFLQPRSQHGAIGARMMGVGGIRIQSKKAPIKTSPPTNQHPAFYRPDALSVAQPTVSEH